MAVLILIALAAGCATHRPAVRIEKGVSLSAYKAFEVAPVSNDTGKTFDFDVAAVLTEHIKSALKDKGYDVAEKGRASDYVLVIQSSLLSYEPGSVLGRWVVFGDGKAQCIVKSTLIDKPTGKTVGEMVTSEAVTGGGLYSIGADKYVLNMAADSIADEIEIRIEGEK